MKIKDMMNEGVMKQKIKIEEGEYKGKTGTIVFSKVTHGDVRPQAVAEVDPGSVWPQYYYNRTAPK